MPREIVIGWLAILKYIHKNKHTRIDIDYIDLVLGYT